MSDITERTNEELLVTYNMLMKQDSKTELDIKLLRRIDTELALRGYEILELTYHVVRRVE